MNTNTQTVDERCADLSGMAFGHAAHRQFRTLRDDLIFLAKLADRIIAERTREAAQALRAQMPKPGYNPDGTRQTVTYDGLTREEWIVRELAQAEEDEARDDIEARGARERGEVQS